MLLTTKAARFRVASQSGCLNAGMERTRATKDHKGGTLEVTTRSWDEKYFHTTTAFQTFRLQPRFAWSMPYTTSRVSEACTLARCSQVPQPCIARVVVFLTSPIPFADGPSLPLASSTTSRSLPHGKSFSLCQFLQRLPDCGRPANRL